MSVEHSYPFKRLVGDVVRPKTLAMPVKRLAGAIIKPINAPKSTVCSEKTPRGLMKRTGKVAKFVDAYVKGHKDATLDDIKEAYRAEYQPKRLPGQIMTYVKQYYAHLVAPKATKSTKAVSEASDCGVFKYPTVAESKAYWKSLKNDSNPGVLSTPIVVQRGNSIIRRRVRDIIDERLAKSMYCEFNAVLTQYMYDFEDPNDKEFDYVEKYYHKYINSSKFAVKVDWNVADLNARNQLINYMHANSETYLRSIVEYKWQISEMVEAEYSNAQSTNCVWGAGSVSMSDDCEDSKINQESRNIMDGVLMELVEYCEARELVRWANSKNSWVFKFQEGKNKYGDELTLPRSLFEDCESISELGYKNQIGGDSSESESESESDSDLTESDGYESDPIFDWGMENICLYCDSRDTWRCNKSKECGCFDCEELWDDTCNECKLSCEEGRCPYHSTEADSGTCETDCDTDDLGSDWDNHDSDYDPDDEGSDSDSDNDVVTPGGFEYYDNAEEKSHVSEIPMNKPITPISGPTESDCDESEFSSDVGSDIDMPFGDTVATYDGYDNEPQIVTDTVTIPEIQYDHVAMYIPPVEVYISDSESEAPIESKLDEIDNGYETPCFDDNGEQIDPTIELGDTPNPQVSAGVAAIMNNVNTNIGQGCWSMISDFVQDFKRAHHYKKVLNQIKTFPKRYEKLSYRRHKFYEYYGFGYMNTRRCVKWEQDANGNIIVINLYDEADIMDQRRTETIPSDQLCDESGLPWDAPHRDFTDFENESESDDDDSDWVEHPEEEYNPIVSDQDLVDRQTVRSAITRAHMIRYGDDWDFDAVDRISEHRMELLESGVSVATILRREVIIHQVHTFPSIDLVNVETVDEPDVLPPVPEMTEITDIERELEEQPEVIYLILTKQPTKKLLGGNKQCDDFRENGCKPNAPKFKKRDRPRFVETMGGVIDTLNDCGPTEYQQHIARQILAKEMEQVGPIMPLERQTAEPTCYQTEVNYDFNDSLENAAYITYDSPCNGSILIAREQFNKWQNIDDTPRWTFTADSDISELPEFEVDPISGCPMVNMQAFRHWVHLKQYKLGDKRIPKDRTSVADNEAYKHYCELYLCPRRTQKMEKIDQSIIDESFVDTLIAEDWFNYVTCKIDTCPDLVGYLGYGEKASKRVDRIMDLFFKLLSEAKYPQTDNNRKFRIGDLALHIQTKTSKMQRQTCKYCECDQIVYSEQYRVWKCAKCQEVQGGLLGGMLRGRGMQFGNSRSRMQNNRIFNNNGDVRRMQDDAFDAALSVANGVQAGPIDTDELDADDILAELNAVEQENNQSESPRTLVNQFNAIIDEINAFNDPNVFPVLDRITSPEPELFIPDSKQDPFADDFGQVDTVVNAVPAVGSPGRRLAMINFEADQGTVIGFDSSSDSEDRKDDSDFSDFAPLPVIPEERPHADAFANQVMIDNDDFRPIAVNRVNNPTGISDAAKAKVNIFEDVPDQFPMTYNDNENRQQAVVLVGEAQNAARLPLRGRVLFDAGLDRAASFFDEVHIRSRDDTFYADFQRAVRNVAVTIYARLGMNPAFRRGISARSVMLTMKQHIDNSDLDENLDELDIIQGVGSQKQRFKDIADKVLSFIDGLRVYNLSFRLRNADSRQNSKYVGNQRKSIGILMSDAVARVIAGNLTGNRRNELLKTYFVDQLDMYDESDDFDASNIYDVQLKGGGQYGYHKRVRMNNGEGVCARYAQTNLMRYLRRGNMNAEAYIRSFSMPEHESAAKNARDEAIRVWKFRNNTEDEQLARMQLPSGDCVCKYIADSLNNFYEQTTKRSEAHGIKRKRILVTPQQIANEFIDLGLMQLNQHGFTCEDIKRWARDNKPGRRFISIYVYSPHKLRVIDYQAKEKMYAGCNVLRLGFVPFDGHLYPVDTDKYASRDGGIDYWKERLKKKLCGVRKSRKIDVSQLQQWVDGEFNHVCHVDMTDLLPVLKEVFEQKNIICDQCSGKGDNHIDTIIHPITGYALIANPDYDTIRDICDNENKSSENSEDNPFMPEFMNPNTQFSVVGQAFMDKYCGQVQRTPIDGGLFGKYERFKPKPMRQKVDDAILLGPEWDTIGMDFKNCYPTLLSNNVQDFPLFTKFDEIKDFDKTKDEIKNNCQYFVQDYEYMRFKFGARVVHGSNMKSLLSLDRNIINYIVSYREAKEVVPANTFTSALQLMKEKYPDSYKQMANQFIGACNKKEITQVFNYVSTNQDELLNLQADIERSHLLEMFTDERVTTSQSVIELDDINNLYILSVRESQPLKANLGYVYDVVMDNYLTKLHLYIKVIEMNEMRLNYIKVDCLGLAYQPRRDRTRLRQMHRLKPEPYSEPTFEYDVTTDMPPREDKKQWSQCDNVDILTTQYISGPAGSGKTTRVFKQLAKLIKERKYPFKHCYVTAHQNKTTQDNKRKCLEELQRAGVRYSIEDMKVTINNIVLEFDSFDRWRFSHDKGMKDVRDDGSELGLMPDHFIVDEVSMLSTTQLARLYDYKEYMPLTKFTIAGDFEQLPPVNQRGKYDIYTSSLFRKLCDYREFKVALVLGQCRFQTQETINILNYLRKFKRLPSGFTSIVKPCEPALNNNLVYTNAKKDKIINEKDKSNDKLKSGDMVVFQVKNCKRSSERDINGQDVRLSGGDKVRSDAKKLGYYVGGEYVVVENMVETKMMKIGHALDDPDTFTCRYENVISVVVGTVHKAQGGKIDGVGNIWEWNRMSHQMRYTALTRFTDIRNVRINNARSAAREENIASCRVLEVRQFVPETCVMFTRNDKITFYKTSDKKKSPPDYIPYGDATDPNYAAKEAQNRKEYDDKYGSDNDRTPMWIVIKDKRSSTILNEFIQYFNGDIQEGYHYAQCNLNLDGSTLLDECWDDVIDHEEKESFEWQCPFATFKNGVRYPARAKYIRISYKGRDIAEVRAEMREKMRECINEITRTQCDKPILAPGSKKFTLSKGKWVPIIDENMYYERIQDVYDEKDEDHNKVLCEPTFFHVNTREINQDISDIKLRHKEYMKMAHPLHCEMKAGVTSDYRTFKFGNYYYFNETFDNMCHVLLTKNRLQELGCRWDRSFSNLYQEICTVNSRMYFDIDIPDRVGKDRYEVLKQFMKALRIHFLKMSDRTNVLENQHVRVLMSTSTKISFHISVINEVFPTPDHQLYFVRQLVNYIRDNAEIYDQLLWKEGETIKCAIDDNAYHLKQSVRTIFSKKDGKDNTLIPYILLDDDSLVEDDFSAYDWRDRDAVVNDALVDKCKEYLICASHLDFFGFSQFSKIEGCAKKKGKKVAYGKPTNCDKKQLKQVSELLRNIQGFDLNKTQAVYDFNGKFLKYNIFRNGEEHQCPACNCKHNRQNAVLQEYAGTWRYYCYQKGKYPVIVATK